MEIEIEPNLPSYNFPLKNDDFNILDSNFQNNPQDGWSIVRKCLGEPFSF